MEPLTLGDLNFQCLEQIRMVLKMLCDAHVYLLDNIFIRFGTKLYRQTIGIRWELIVLLLLQICFFFVMREIS